MDGEEPTKKIKTEDNDSLSQLKRYTNIVADTGQFSQIQQYSPEDATTNPSLILQAASLPEYKEVFAEAISYGKENFNKLKEDPNKNKRTSKRSAGKNSSKKEEPEKQEEPEKEFNYNELSDEDKNLLLSLIVDKLAVTFGKKILEIVPGVVSSEVDARLSFDKQGTIARAKRIIQLYEELGISKERILIKIAATWEGIEAAKALKREKIKCNLTLIFGQGQAVACGDAGIHLISPFVGRILDWHKKQNPDKAAEFVNEKCPGVQSVTKIYNYFKKHDIKTIVMGASFRNTGQILSLAGCDKLTISPKLLGDLSDIKDQEVKQFLKPENVEDMDIEKLNIDEKTFRWMLNEDQCASDLLPAGIRAFAKDTEKLETLIDADLKANPTIIKSDKKEEEKIVEEEKNVQE